MTGLRLTIIAGLLIISPLPLIADDTAGRIAATAIGAGENFPAPRLLALRIDGIAGDSETTILLERTDTGERLEIPVDRWRPSIEAVWLVPKAWVGTPVHVVLRSAIPHGTPPQVTIRTGTNSLDLLVRQMSTLLLPLIVIACAVVALSPGIAFLVAFARPGVVPRGFELAGVYLLTAAIGYLVFWLFFVDHRLGFVVSIALVVASLSTIGVARRRAANFFVNPDFIVPLMLVLLASTFYLGVLLVAGGGRSIDSVAPTRFFLARPLDNLIPEYFADRLYQGGDPRVTGPEWHSSDRPPLQTGITLLVRPACDAVGIGTSLQYQVVGTLLQCMWIPVLWAICTTLKLRSKQTAIVFALMIFSGFFLYNAVYVWPKLLAGSLLVLAMLLILRREATTGTLVVAGISSALALLAHTGVVFTLIGAAIAFLSTRVLKPVRQMRGLALGGLAAILLLTPWLAYQKIYDPPGDRLLKIHLAGARDLGDKRPAGEAIADAWRSLTFEEILVRKLHSFRTLAGFDSIMSSAVFAEDLRLTEETLNDPVLMWRSREQQHVGTSLGLLNLGWIPLAALVVLLKRRGEAGDRTLLILVATGLCGLASSALIFFSGGNTVTTHVSYGDILLLHAGLAIALSDSRRVVIVPLLSTHLVLFAWIWLMTSPPVPSFALPYAPNVISILIAAVSATLIAAMLGAMATERLGFGVSATAG